MNTISQTQVEGVIGAVWILLSKPPDYANALTYENIKQIMLDSGEWIITEPDPKNME